MLDILIDAFQKKEYDRGLLEAVQFVEKTLDDNMPHTAGRRVR